VTGSPVVGAGSVSRNMLAYNRSATARHPTISTWCEGLRQSLCCSVICATFILWIFQKPRETLICQSSLFILFRASWLLTQFLSLISDGLSRSWRA
jgi:hypothetical protein